MLIVDFLNLHNSGASLEFYFEGVGLKFLFCLSSRGSAQFVPALVSAFTDRGAAATMKLHLVLPFICTLLSVQQSLLLQVCPALCRCDWITNSVTCAGVDVLPQFCSCTQEVWMVASKLLFIPQDAFASLPNVSRIHISDDTTLTSLRRHSFFNLSRILHIRSSFHFSGISNTGLRWFPGLQQIRSGQEDFLEIVENAFIQVIPANSFSGISERALTAILSGNGMKKIESLAFNGSRLEEVYDFPCSNTFLTLKEHFSSSRPNGCLCCSCRDVSETRVTSLPPLGMNALEKLRAESVWALEVMPPFSAFPHLQRAELTFPSHCCGLQNKIWEARSDCLPISHLFAAHHDRQQHNEPSVGLRGINILPFLENIFVQRFRNSNNPGLFFSEYLPASAPEPHRAFCPGWSVADGAFRICPSRGAFSPAERLIEDFDLSVCTDTDSRPSCTPTPDALNPCEDVMSRAFLRVLVWVVSLVAISANLLVLLILLSCQQKLSVTRFLMGHLAFADGCMGTYLLLIASVDFYTRSRYHRYAVAWQTGSGCSLAGVLSVFASELSVYTLTTISVQRWHAIFNAMRPHRKMRLRHAAALMLIGWLLCITAAVLPLVGVNTYQRVSICLPMDTESTAARAYLVSVLTANLVAFMVVCLCYLHIYCMVHNSQHASSRSDNSMAKRMAALIFTNFLCLAPVCFYGLSATFNRPLMTFTDSKVLLVLFYPLNSCVHPFFYAILTKAFHRDTLMLLSRMGLCQRQAHLYRSRLFPVSPHIYRGSPPHADHCTTMQPTSQSLKEISSQTLTPHVTPVSINKGNVLMNVCAEVFLENNSRTHFCTFVRHLKFTQQVLSKMQEL
uniref:Thyrotropin receptor n=1 Tax=Oryzias latipes TaxID=8090 RepID=A0A3P9K559_ORYLA